MTITDSLPSAFFGPAWICLCAMARLGPAVCMMPPIAGSSIPVHIKAILVLGCSSALSPMIATYAGELPEQPLEAGISLLHELLLGSFLGTSVLIVTTSLHVGSQLLSTLSDLDGAQSIDPMTEESGPVFQQLMSLIAMAMFLLFGGHRILIGAVLDSFVTIPPGTMSLDERWISHLHALIGHGMAFGLRAVLPAVFALVVARLATGWIARFLPQLGPTNLGTPLQVVVTLLVLASSMTGIGWVYQHELVLWRNTTIELYSHPANPLESPSSSSIEAENDPVTPSQQVTDG